MKSFKFLFFLLLTSPLFFFTSCLNGDNSATYTNVYGYVNTVSGVTFVNTSAGYQVTWSGIESKLSAGDCVVLSFTLDYSNLNGYYLAQNPSFAKLDTYPLTADNIPAKNDSNFITGVSNVAWSSTAWFDDNFFLYYMTGYYKGVTIEPSFSYSTAAISSNFDVDKDSVIIEMRPTVTNSATSSKTTTTGSGYCCVSLSAIRNSFKAMGYSGKYIPIYFRFYPSATITKTTDVSKMLID